MNLILELIFAKVNDLLKALHKYFDTLISDQDKAKSFQEAESVLVSHSPKLFFLDNTLAENEWLQMNLLLTIVMVKEIPASLKWIFNNE